MKAHRAWQALYLASATPMQMAAHEAWDLIELLGLNGAWADSADQFVQYFAELRRPPEERDWTLLTRMLRDQIDAKDALSDEALRTRVVDELGPVLVPIHSSIARTAGADHGIGSWAGSQAG